VCRVAGAAWCVGVHGRIWIRVGVCGEGAQMGGIILALFNYVPINATQKEKPTFNHILRNRPLAIV